MANQPSPAQLVRDLVHGRDRAALATALPEGTGSWPYASLTLVAVDHDLSPILLLSDLADHSRAIAADDRVSLLFDGTAGFEQPLTGPRVSLLGRAASTDDARLKRRYLAHHPDAGMYAGFKDFKFYRVAVERAHLVGGFGRIHWLSASDLLSPSLADSAAAFGSAEESILAHMNTDHADAIQRYAQHLLGLDGEGWIMTGLDAEGFDLRRQGEVARLAFETPLRGPDEVRAVLVDLASKAGAA